MASTAKELVSRVVTLVTFPKVAIQISSLLAQESVASDDIAKLIYHDPGLTAVILRAANSALLSTGTPVDSIPRAITRLGLERISELLVAADISRSFQGFPNNVVSLNDFWRHSLCCACVAQALARIHGYKDVDVAFTAGLLHDIGQLVIFSQYPDLSRDLLAISLNNTDGLCIHQAEKKVLGYDHTGIGAELATLWNLPENLRDCIAGHHDPMILSADKILPTIVHIANSLAVMIELEVSLHSAPPIAEGSWEILKLSPDSILEELKRRALAHYEPMASALF